MPNTYVALATQTLGTATNSVTFSLSGISGYTDLMLEINGAVASGNPAIWYRVNGDSTSLYSFTRVTGNGTSALSSRESTQTKGNIASAFGMTTTFETNIQVHFMNYSNTTTNKTLLARANTPSLGTEASVNLWRNTNAITSIEILTSSGTNFVAGSTFNLYGIANADQGAAKATGGIITEDANYWYHTFGASGAFIPKQSLTCDVLVVAGGGGAGFDRGGGGGAGGLLGFTSQAVTATSYSITVGAGGPGGTASGGGTKGTNGNNSQFQGLTAAVGGGGGGNYILDRSGSSGGSGGGAQPGTGGTTTGSVGTTGQGNAGGSGTTDNATFRSSGGGGGAGGAGANGSTVNSNSGNGGIGATFNSTVGGTAGPYSFINDMGAATGTGQLSNGNYYYAGGGGGGNGIPGTGGLGGGGSTDVDGTANTGGGAGAGAASPAKSGGSGVIIVRYAK